MASIFTKIIKGEMPCHKLYEDDLTFSFLTIAPINPGHALVVPKEEVDHITDVPQETYLRVMKNSQTIAKAIHHISGAKRVAFSVQGFEVPHFHVHLIPVNSPSEFDFKLAKNTGPEKLEHMAKLIREELKKD